MSGPFKMKGHTLPGPNQASPAKQTTDRETMREKAREKKKNEPHWTTLSDKDRKKRRRESNRGAELPRVPTEGKVAHTLRKAATWLGVGNEKAKKRNKKTSRIQMNTPPTR